MGNDSIFDTLRNRGDHIDSAVDAAVRGQPGVDSGAGSAVFNDKVTETFIHKIVDLDQEISAGTVNPVLATEVMALVDSVVPGGKYHDLVTTVHDGAYSSAQQMIQILQANGEDYGIHYEAGRMFGGPDDTSVAIGEQSFTTKNAFTGPG